MNLNNIPSIWFATSIDETPYIVLEQWSVFRLQYLDNRASTDHLVGWNATEHEGRGSSGIVEFDPSSGKVRTNSGRLYELRGRPGSDRDARMVWFGFQAVRPISTVEQLTLEYWNRLLRRMVT